MKKFVGFLLIYLILTGCNQENKPQGDFVAVTIADRTFKIPKGYLDGRKAIGKDTESIVLEYSLPNFEILPPHPQEREARQKLIDDGRMKGMLLESSARRPSFDEMIDMTLKVKKYGIGYIVDENFYGLEKNSVQNWGDYKSTTPDDTFIERGKDGSVVSYLKCSPEGKDKNPGCRHKFHDKGVLYAIRWSIRELPNWKQQQSAAIAFIDGFEVKKSKILGEK